MKKLSKELVAQIAELTPKLADLKEAFEQAADDADAYYDEKSEKWQEGDAGAAYNDWKDLLREVYDSLEEVVGKLEDPPIEPQQ